MGIGVYLLLAVVGLVPNARAEEETAVIETLLNQELVSKTRGAKELCLAVDGGSDPSRSLLEYLKEKGFRFRMASWCSKPPRGVVVVVGRIAWQDSVRADVVVEVSDLNLDGAHFGTLLGKVSYTLERQSDGTWRVSSQRKLCC